MKLVLASQNAHKITELQTLLSEFFEGIDILSLREAGVEGDIVEDGSTFAENALIKARAAATSGLAGIGDDSGLEVYALDRAPGIYSARYAGEHGNDAANNQKLLAELQNKADRRGAFVCAIAVVLPDGRSIVVEGRTEGEILTKARGEGGFGYDPLFYYPPMGKTFSEMSAEEKNAISHRGNALRKFAEQLKEYYDVNK